MPKKIKNPQVKDLVSSPVIGISFSKKISDAVSKMKENDISCLPVTKNGNLKGIVFYRDIIEKGVDPDKEIFNVMKQPRNVLSSKGIIKVAQQMAVSKLKALPVLEKGKLVGIISRHDLTQQVAKSEEFKRKKVKSIMSKPVLTVSKDNSLLKARSLMLANDIRRLPVTDDDKLVGIITLTDIAEKVYKKGKTERLLSRPVIEVMSSPVITIGIDDLISLAAKKTVENDISGLPVLENSKLVGIVTQLDLVKEVAKL